jgi:hypothetical protein
MKCCEKVENNSKCSWGGAEAAKTVVVEIKETGLDLV